MQNHEIFNELAVVGEAVDDEPRVVHLLASLPESFSMMVTALEANKDVPKMEVVTERLIHEEKKVNERAGDRQSKAALISKEKKEVKDTKCYNCQEKRELRDMRDTKCYNCQNYGHIARNCPEKKAKPKPSNRGKKHKVHRAAAKMDSSSDSDCVGLTVRHAL